jgi:hypothetical protein
MPRFNLLFKRTGAGKRVWPLFLTRIIVTLWRLPKVNSSGYGDK